MKILMQLLAWFCLLVGNLVVAAEPPAEVGQTQVVGEKAKIIVIRADVMVSAAVDADVWVNEKEIGSVKAGAVLYSEAEPGKMKLRIKPGILDMIRVSKTIQLDVVAGESYYFFADRATFSGFHWKLLPKDEALPLIEKYKSLTQFRKDIQEKGKEL